MVICAARPIVSVVIPTYNRVGLLVRAIVSVQKQSVQDIEIIVIDDGSTDETENAVASLKKQDSRIIFTKLKNNSGGPARPKNEGIRQAQGYYIAILDSDDVWEPNKLKLQLAAAEEGYTVVGCGYYHEDRPVMPTISGCVAKILIRDYLGPGSCMLYSRAVFDRVGLFDENLRSGQDWDMRIRLFKDRESCTVVRDPLVRYSIYSDSVSARARSRINRDLRAITRKHGTTLLKYPIHGLKHGILLFLRHVRTWLGLDKGF